MPTFLLILLAIAALIVFVYLRFAKPAKGLLIPQRSGLYCSVLGNPLLAALSEGNTAYWEWGNPEAETSILLIHGFMFPSRIWMKFVEQEAFLSPTNSRRVIAFDLYGRGYSDAPDKPNTVELFTAQAFELLQFLGVKHVCVCGVSMGAVISTALASKYPEVVQKLALISPAGLPVTLPIPRRIAMGLTQLPVLGDVMYWLLSARMIRSGVSANFPAGNSGALDPAELEELQIMCYEQICRMQNEHPGFMRSLHSTLRNFPLNDAQEEFASLGALDIPVLVQWGTADALTPFSNSVKLQALVPRATIIPRAGLGHWALAEDAPAVLRAVLAFFSPS